MNRLLTAVARLLVIGLLAAGCSDDASPFSTTTEAAPTTEASTTTVAEPDTTQPTAAETTTTTVAATTVAATTTTFITTTVTTVTTVTTTTVPAGCPGPGAGSIPAGAEEVSSRSAMLDSDGLTDTFSAFQEAGTWQLHADLGTGFTARLVLDADWAAQHWPLGVRNVAVERAHGLGSTEQVVVVRIYTGTVAAYGLFALEDCRIVAFTDDNERLPDLWVGMGPTHSDWPVCGPGSSIFQVIFSSPAGCGDIETCATPDLTITEYRVLRNPAGLEYVGESSRASTQAEMDDFRSRTCPAP